ncbi:SDR family oxidoreductase [Streptomyces tremellae]
MSIVITGATGHLGRRVVADLLAAGVPADGITAVARTKEKAESLTAAGVRVHIADYDDPASFEGAFHPGDRVLLISGTDIGRRAPQHAVVIDAAKTAGVAQLAYTGVLGGPKADFLLAADHRETERLILESGLPYTFLRNGWYTEAPTIVGDLGGVLERGEITSSTVPGARIAAAPRADFAEAAAHVLREDGHLGRAYELSGDTAWTMDEIAEELSRQSGRTVVHRRLTPEEQKAAYVGAGLPEGFAEVLVDVDAAINRGLLAPTPGDLARLLGRPTTPLAESVRTALAELG